MATKKKGSTSKKSGAKSRTQPQQNAEGRRQMMSVIWFTAAIFFMCVVFVKGQNIWAGLHNFIFGVFGVTAYFYPFLMGFVQFHASGFLYLCTVLFRAHIKKEAAPCFHIVLQIFGTPSGTRTLDTLIKSYGQIASKKISSYYSIFSTMRVAYQSVHRFHQFAIFPFAGWMQKTSIPLSFFVRSGLHNAVSHPQQHRS